MSDDAPNFITKTVAIQNGGSKTLTEALSWIVQMVDSPEFVDCEGLNINIQTLKRASDPNAPSEEWEDVYGASIAATVKFDQPDAWINHAETQT